MNWLNYYNLDAGSLKSSNDNIQKSFTEESIPKRLDDIKAQKNRLLAEEGQLIEKGLHSMKPFFN